jgi:hypothetical protein
VKFSYFYCVGEGKWWRKGRKMNTMLKRFTHACKCNKDTCCNYFMNQGSRDKGSYGGGESKYDIVDKL